MITGDAKLESTWSLFSALRGLKIDPELLLALFEKSGRGLTGESLLLHKLVHSPLTPDTLEGMHRTGRVIGVSVPHPELFIRSMEMDLLSGVRLREEASGNALTFWRS